jgi:hypothetical protein
MARKPNFYEVLSAAVSDIADHGFDSEERLAEWMEKIRKAAIGALPSEAQMEQMLRDGLRAKYKALLGGEIARYHPGADPALFTKKALTDKMKDELDKRIMASAQLIRLNRDRAISTTLQRFAGWTTSIPSGGTDQTNKTKIKGDIKKRLSSLPFEERRVLIDQGTKLIASINEVIAQNTGAIAGRWHSNFRQPGYDARPDHEERDGDVFAVRGNWALERGLMKASPNGYTDDIEKPAELPFCRCYYHYIYNLRSLPLEMLTAKGVKALSDARAKTAS